ncbi:hypothetical protein FRZ67_23235 [Panacibacter ginsenosidivorans]|uniref:Uncharacterized protein n=2 Tax=Panacibacter ginsenosidivorans TaxID=1813871 RepID=A0A5B8VEZ1_9BACT|nr:hypothetical protein [Panacibacter ginsenosidivorans]QEC70074.1 hypothetical protein FRZ67_23235 [Panacibacter ginsenosidivorans]
MTNQAREILITEDTLVSDIQEIFSSFYPFLKIEFSKLQSNSQSLQKSRKVLPQDSIKNITNAMMPVKLRIENKRTIAQVEDDCIQQLGLLVQISRKSGNVWNTISLTENWTLEEQNNAGKFISSEMKLPPVKE